ncbi:glycosyltransferase [uncultured Algoriphagus sp.]|uniref:glycosyltransferase n=1 Tax=uncultured Algoriphagus sp. TaxID=417365 RepID=UPI0030EE0B15|tara:strand:+ start:867 stop:1955 length:1089 start_codon:yes stop_codon:yes gene_type:complete
MINIFQELVPHYRLNFFEGLSKKFNLSLFTLNNLNIDNLNVLQSFPTKKVKSFRFFKFLWINPYRLLVGRPRILVLMLHPGHLFTWVLLLTKRFHKTKIVLWGHGISVNNYLREEKNYSKIRLLMINLSDYIWLYTEREELLLSSLDVHTPLVALGNTISDVDLILNDATKFDINRIKSKYNINQPFIFIFCARFNILERRIDLLLQIIQNLDSDKFGFIIIGDGTFKPDFSIFPNVYDFGSLYDNIIKNDLFRISNAYLQPGWLGLSVVEAMSYGLAPCTFKRSNDVKQCVEYGYLDNGVNSKIFDDLKSFIEYFTSNNLFELNYLGDNARNYIRQNLRMENMICNASSSINYLSSNTLNL